MAALFNKRFILLSFVIWLIAIKTGFTQDLYPWKASISKINTDYVISIEGNSEFSDTSTLFINDKSIEDVVFRNGIGSFVLNDIENRIFYLHADKEEHHGQLLHIKESANEITIRKIPLWVSILPPLIAILLALLLKEVFIALFCGVWIGSFALYGFNIMALWSSFLYSFDYFIVNNLKDSGHISVVIFSMLIGGMVALISRNGGMNGVVNILSKFANSAKNAQLVTWFLGVAIFFDDYANTLIVGNTMRSVTDKFKISREKLAYIVDSTAAPIAAIALVTTWIGAELGYIEGAIQGMGIDQSVYSIFLNSLRYSFYPVLTLLFILVLILLNKDFGPMLKAEHRARKHGLLSAKKPNSDSEATEDLNPKPGVRQLAFNAIIPVLLVIGVTFYGLLRTGSDPSVWAGDGSFFSKLSTIIGGSDSYIALIWASATGMAAALFLSLGTKTWSLEESIDAILAGFKTMLPTMIILVLAWSLANTTEALHTSDFLIGQLSGNLDVRWTPIITFILAALISFSTGSSWSTMAILYPLMLPLTWTLGIQQGVELTTLFPIFYNVIAVVLGGSVLGDHCSPISDTTVLSSLASGCNHLDHVKTQMPYALTVGLVSMLCGGILATFTQIPWYVIFLLGSMMIIGIVKFMGKKIEV